MRWRRSNALLAALTLLAAAVWLVVLPRLAATEAMGRRLEAAERAGIDPGAVFWTDHAQSSAPLTCVYDATGRPD